MLKRELYLKQIRPYMNTELIKVITGIRRSGKSVLLQSIADELLDNGIAKEQVHIINFESELIPDLKTYEGTLNYLHKLLKLQGRHYILLDEVQELPDWQKIVNSLQIDFDVDIYLTGSNAKLLSGELATYLAGRYVEFKVYPFSLAECIALKQQKGQKPDKSSTFLEYIQLGGMPVIHQQELAREVALKYLSDVYDSIILKDIIMRNQVRDAEFLQRLILFLISNIGHIFSASSLIKYLKSQRKQVSYETIYSYLEYCKTASFLHLVEGQDLKGKNILKRQDKIYLADHGIREAIYGNNTRDIDQILENIVYVEMLRRGYSVTVGKIKGREVDFVGKRNDQIIYVQVAYLLATPETVQREFQVYYDIPDNYPKYVVTMDPLTIANDGIRHVRMEDFLLSQEW